MTRIAFIDNQRGDLAQVRSILSNENFSVDTYKDPQFAMDSFKRCMPDLVAISLPVSKIDGVALIEQIRSSSMIPLVLLSPVRDEIEEIMGLRYGADDYIHLPISPRLLSERLKALLRRHAMLLAYSKTPAETEKTLTCGDLTMDPCRYTVSWKTRSVSLTATEFRILQALVRRPGIVKTRDQLLNASYPADVYIDDRTIDSRIKRIRNKLRIVDPEFANIETLYGIGYRFNAPIERQDDTQAFTASHTLLNRSTGSKNPTTSLGRVLAWPSKPAAKVPADGVKRPATATV